MTKVRWARPAVSDLLDIVRYVARDDPEAARRLGRPLESATKDLAHHPEMGRMVPEFGDETVRELVRGNDRLIYRVRKDVQVIAVVEGHRLLPETIVSEEEP